MNKEAYISFETAQRLKEKGFDWKVFHFYDGDGHLMHREGDCYSLYNWNYPTKDEYGSHYCSAPTQQMACDWLREEREIDIIPVIRHVLNTHKRVHLGIMHAECMTVMETLFCLRLSGIVDTKMLLKQHYSTV